MNNKPEYYTPYHVHSMLSNGVTNIDSVTNFRDYVSLAHQDGSKAMGISEHGSLFEWLHKKETIEQVGMKYIHCIEAYLTESIDGKIRDNYHCILIARNKDGVRELNKLVSNSFNRNDNHFYYVPRISFDELFETSDNIIITTACLGGVLNKGSPTAKDRFLSFLIENKDRCFLEIQHHNCEEQIEYNKAMLKLSENYGIPLIAGTDTHALNEEHLKVRGVLQKAKNVNFPEENKWDLTYKTTEQLIQAYEIQNSIPIEDVYKAINNTNVMADMIEPFEIDREKKYPKLYENSEEVFKQKINEGVKKRGINKLPNYKEYLERIKYEFDVYKHNGAIDFMLLEENYKTAMREQGVKYGYSRGSVSGSIIAYLLYITEIDSVKYHLNFDRFMNKERVSLADVDTDWYSSDRDKVKKYLYGKQQLYCSDIVTFNTIALKGAVNDICRGLYKDNKGIDYLKLSNEINSLAESDEQKAREKYPEIFKFVDVANGVVVSVGNHPAGCIVSPTSVDEWMSTFTTSTDEYPISMLNMKEVDSLNFVKLDILGLDNIGLIYKTCEAANIPFATPDNIPPDDINVWNSIRDDTTMIFQWESSSATAYLRQLMSDKTIEKIKEKNPNFSYIDLFSIGNGAIRPAGASYRDELAQGVFRDNGNEALNEFLSPTLGYLVYQEQIIEFLNKFCGYTMGEADVVRRGFAKKTGTEKFIPKIKSGFIKTMSEKYGIDKAESEKLIVNFIKVIEDASSYLFSKNHSDPYSWIGYICGYLRYYYPIEFVTTALNIFSDNEDKSIAIISYAKKQGIRISPIKFRYSVANYSFNKDTNEIYKGLSSIKYLNDNVSYELYNLRDNQYTDFVDLLHDIKDKTSINSRQLCILIELDFFSEFGNVNYLLKATELFDTFAGKRQIKKDKIIGINITNEQMSKLSKKETDKTYIDVDTDSLIRTVLSQTKFCERNLKDIVNSQIEHLGYIDIADKKYARMLVVSKIDTRYSPRIEAYSLKNGKNMMFKVDKKAFAKTKLNKGDIIYVDLIQQKPRYERTDDGGFKAISGTSEIWLKKYSKLYT